jgi:type II secretory pathway component PulM
MASTIDKLREQGRERWDALSERERRLVLVLGITLAAVIVIWIGLRIDSGLSAIEQRNADTRRALAALQNYRMSESKQTDEPALTLSDKPVRLETYLSGIADEVGVKIPAFNPQAPTTRDDFTETSTKIEIRDLSINDLTQFLEKVETRSPTVVVKQLNVQRHFRDKEKLTVNMVVSSFAKATPEGESAGKEG